MAVIRPEGETEATDALLEVYPTPWNVALDGWMVPVNCWVWVIFRVTDVGATVMPVTGFGLISQKASSYRP